MNGQAEEKEAFQYMGMQVYLIFKNGSIKSLWLPEPPEGNYFLGKQVFIEARNGQWHLCSKVSNMISNGSGEFVDDTILSDQCRFFLKHGKGVCVLYVEQVNQCSAVYHNYRICGNCRIKIGKTKDNDLVYPNRTVSASHAVLEQGSNGMVIEDTGSLNGVFVNGRKIERQSLCIGDTVFIMGLKIIIGIGFISMNDGNGRIEILSEKIQPMETDGGIAPKRDEVKTVHRIYKRLPRKKKKFEAEDITIEGPPFSLNSNQMPLILQMGGSMAMGGSALMRGSYASVLSMLLFPLMSRLYTDKDKKEYEKLRCEKYLEYLEEKRTEIKNEKLKEENILNENYPSLDVIARYPKEKKLWERGNHDDDFLSLRIGYGQLPLMACIQYPEKKFNLEEDPLEKEMYLLATKEVVLDHVPIMLPLMENFVCGVVGKAKDKISLLFRMIMQVVFLHSYDEVKLVLLLDEIILKRISAVRYLPHVWNEEHNFRFLASDSASGYLVGEYLNKELEKELEKPRELEKILKERPYYVVFAWNEQIFDSIEVLKRVTREESNIGVSVVTFFDNTPQNAHEIIDLHSDEPNSIIHLKGNREGEDFFYMDEVDYRFANKMMHNISNIRLKMAQGAYDLPKMVTFLELFGVGKVEHLNPLKRWKENNPIKSLAVQVGVTSDGNPFSMDLHEKYHGPHGLVAGMTGSGKSEFIITLILSLAVNFHPDEVAFVLIDYKGGGLAGAFEDEERGIHLPHLVGTITNLDGSTIQRSLMSIESELKRRQRIFNEAKSIANEGTMDIYLYQKLYRSGKVETPLPHLFIISDEFAELKSQEPEFMDQLISAARIGRSLGVHLVLATQKPSGVVDAQINSNTKFRVCLKVQTRSDSEEMLQRPMAAELKDTGRFYLLVGYNEYFALGQSAWCGAPYEPQEEAIVHRDDYVQFIDETGQKIVQARPTAEKKDAGVSQLVAIVQYLSEIAKREGLKRKRLWMDPLPLDISIQDLQKKPYDAGGKSITAVIGMIDDPENQQQYPFILDFLKCKNLLAVGGNQTGKTTLLQTILYALICNYAPNDINYYILDYSSNLLNIFDHTRYCGGVWREGDEEQIEKFFHLLDEIIADRKAKFLAAEVNSFEAYREIKKVPLILVVIDNIAGLSSWERGKNIYYNLNRLIREANTVGIKFLITAGNYDDVMYQVKKEFGTRFVLDAKNKFEYGDILGMNCRFEPRKASGRGLWREEERLLECQIARYGFEGTEQERIQALKEEIRQLAQKHWSEKQARQIPRIPYEETYQEFCTDILPGRIPLGYSVADIKKVSIPLKQLYCMSLYFGNADGIGTVIGNYLYVAMQEGMHLRIMKRSQNSIFDTRELQEAIGNYPNISFFQSVEEDCTKLWKEMYDEICKRKEVRNEYCETHNIAKTGKDVMKQCYQQMRSKTEPLLLVFESFRDFCSHANQEAKNVMEKIFCDGRGYNYYFIGCYEPDDASALSVDAVHRAFNKEGFALLYGGRFHRQGIADLPMEYRNITKPSKKTGSCIMQYHEGLYPLWMPCKHEGKIDLDPDDADIIEAGKGRDDG